MQAAPGVNESTVVCTQRLTRCFGSGTGTVVAVRGVTVAISCHDRIALTGPSGSGKSTLLHLLAGLDEPTAGTVRWLCTESNAARQKVGLVFQGRSLAPNLDVIENVRLPMLFAGFSERVATDRAHEALARLGIDALSEALPDALSGGQAQRVAIARALADTPRLILADEPTGQLDHAAAAMVIDVLLRAADDLSAALIVSTHDPVVARRLTSQWTMRDGRLRVATGSQDQG
ncbi:ABC transporter ATP-binding protein [Mycolicibacterium aromaticivorans]|nr:ATP-binding cassette domain-containing protein [Mycolicibacterium aromaticivorans]